MRYPSYCLEPHCDRISVGGYTELCYECTNGNILHLCRFCDYAFRTKHPIYNHNEEICGDCRMWAAETIKNFLLKKLRC